MEPLLEDEPVATASGSHFPQLQRSTTTPLRRTSTGNLSATSTLRRSKTRQFSRSSTDTSHLDQPFLPPIREDSKEPSHDDATHWHAFALVFVALPAVASIFYENGGAVMTDVLMLALGCLFLYWSVKWPWQWYHAAQGRIYVDFDPDYLEDEDIAVADTPIGTDTEGQEPGPDGTDATGPTIREPTPKSAEQIRRTRATASLRTHELLALASCFGMPLGVAYLLHAIRPYLSRPSGGLISNSNLTLFVLAAEVRPILHVCRMLSQQTMHLQKIVAAPPAPPEDNVPEPLPAAELLERIQALENKLPELTPLPPPKGKEPEDEGMKEKQAAEKEAMVTSAAQSIQPQLDALNRAVRRYEKRATMQTVLLDARLRDLDKRIDDALSLAAAASRMAQKQGLVGWAIDSTSSAISKSIQAILALPLLPYRLTQQTYVFLLGGKQRKRKPKKMELERPKKNGVEVR